MTNGTESPEKQNCDDSSSNDSDSQEALSNQTETDSIEESPTGHSDENRATEPQSNEVEVQSEQESDVNVNEDERKSDDPEVRVELLRAELAVAKDQVLRSLAEAENARKRAEREIFKAHRYALESFGKSLLDVVDNFERTLEAAAQHSFEKEIHTALIQGVELTLKSFLSALEAHGITPIDPTGEPFNPEHHKALTMIENPDTEPGSVVEVVRKGYLLRDRLLREADVIVSKEPGSSD